MARGPGERTVAAPPQQLAAHAAAGDVVQGIKLQVTGRELAVRIGERIRWHRERGDVLLAQMKKFAAAERESESDLQDSLGRYESPRVVLEKKLREHRDRASFLAFVRDHVNDAATYRLDSIDLKMMEILPEKCW